MCAMRKLLDDHIWFRGMEPPELPKIIENPIFKNMTAGERIRYSIEHPTISDFISCNCINNS